MAVAVSLDEPAPVDDAWPGRRPRDHRTPAWALLVLAVVLFGGFAARTIAAPFGDSHDGRNAGVWAAGSRSLLERGPVASRLGTRSPENGVYANHPPLLYVETALFDAVGGSSTAATRAPAWLGTLAALALLTALLTEVELRPVAVGVAVVLVAATPMLLVYGAMLDTPVASLPFGLAVLWAWERARRGRRVPWPLSAGLPALAVLAGWQSLLVAAVVGLWATVRLCRRSGSRRVNVAFAGGALIGAVALIGWLAWAFGATLAPLFDQFHLRTGQTAPVAWSVLLGAVGHDTATMFGVGAVLAVGGLVVAIADRRTRGLAAIALGVTLPYPLVFRSGIVNHDYWIYWFLLPLAVGLAAGCSRLLPAGKAIARREVEVAAAAVVFAIALTVLQWARPDAAAWDSVQGRLAGSVATSRTLPPNQESAWYTGSVGEPAAWLALATRRPAVAVPVPDLGALAAAHPQDMILVGRKRCVRGETHIAYAFEPVAGLVATLHEVGRC